MDPINEVLDETFFKVASPECLTALSKLIDDALAVRFTSYLDSTTVDSSAATIIDNYLGQVIKAATSHIQLLRRGSAKVVEKIGLEIIANTQFDQRAVIEELEFPERNIKYVRSSLEPRRKTDYDALMILLPADYETEVINSRVMFYRPHAKIHSTGVDIINRKRDAWTIVLKGLEYHRYIARPGYAIDSYMVKEF